MPIVGGDWYTRAALDQKVAVFAAVTSGQINICESVMRLTGQKWYSFVRCTTHPATNLSHTCPVLYTVSQKTSYLYNLL